MKKRVMFGAVIIALIFVCLALNTKIVDPADFTGVWYRAGEGVPYIFQNGIIECADKENIVLDGEVFSGAYSFAKDKAAIFVVGDDGVGEVVELILVRGKAGDTLCEKRDGTLVMWFCRYQESSTAHN